MRLVSVTVQLFWNFVAAQTISIKRDVTCLLGKNESGKTTLRVAQSQPSLDACVLDEAWRRWLGPSQSPRAALAAAPRGTRMLTTALTSPLRAARLLFAALLCALLLPTSALAAQHITSSGPLDSIYAGDGLECQVHYTGDSHGEFYGGEPGSCGTLIGVGGPVSSGGAVYGIAGTAQLTPDAQVASGHGTAADPYAVATAVIVGNTGLRMTQTDTYTVGSDKYSSRVLITNPTDTPQSVVLYHGADCYLGDSDIGYGYRDATNGGIFCTKNANNSPAGRVEGFVPTEGGSHHLETHYSTNWSAIRSGSPLADTCACDTFQDNGAAISWTLTVPAQGAVTRSWATVFSPVGTIHVHNYVALGDSVAAGEGIGYNYEWSASAHKWVASTSPSYWEWDTLTQDAGCHQTIAGYPHALSQSLGAGLTDLACTGASVADGLFRPKDGQRGAQLGSAQYADADAPARRYDDAQPDIVTLTVGADDISFADKVGACYTVSLWSLQGSCGGNEDRSELARALTRQTTDLRRALTEIRNRGQAAGRIPVVAVTQYYNPFPASYPTDSGCVDINPARRAGITLTSDEMTYLQGGLKKLNDNIASVAHEFRNVVVVAPPSGFVAHRWCTDNPWVYGPSLRVGFNTSSAPFHPTPEGQQAIADNIASVLSNQRHVSTGNQVPVDFGDVHLLYAAVNLSGTSFLNTYNPHSTYSPQRLANRRAAASVSAPADIPVLADGLPPARDFLPVHVYTAGDSAQYTGGMQVTLPAEGATALYEVINGAWQRITATADASAGTLTAHLDVLGPLAVGNPVAPVTAAMTVAGDSAAPTATLVNGSSSSVSAGSISSYHWDFGDGNTATGATAQHAYTSAGTYTATLVAVSDQGASDTVTRDITVTNPAPVASLEAPATATPGQNVNFDASGSHDANGHIVETFWDFGDGSTADSGATVQHAFTTPGSYPVTVHVLDDEGAQDTASSTVIVATPGAPAPQPATATTEQPQAAAPKPPAPVVAQSQPKLGPAKLRLGKLLHGKKGAITMKVTCLAGGGACRGTVALSVMSGHRTITVATATFDLQANASKTVRLTVPKAGRRYVKKGHSKLRLTATAHLPGVKPKKLGTLTYKP
jgi:PKD repeat protein/lysophospholipase L1-like esterase